MESVWAKVLTKNFLVTLTAFAEQLGIENFGNKEEP